MKNGFDKLSVKYIRIEEFSQLAEVDVEYHYGKVMIETRLILGMADLNYLLAKLNAKGLSLNIDEDFECFQTQNGSVFVIDLERKGEENVVLDWFAPRLQLKQIRA